MERLKAWIDQERVSAWLYLMPALILLSVFFFYPAVRLFIDSFFEWDGMGERIYLGLEN